MNPTCRRDRQSRRLCLWRQCHSHPGGSLLHPGACAAAETKDVPWRRRPTCRAPRSAEEQATQAALQALPGKVTDVTIEKKRGKTVYVIEIVAEKDGAETDVLVDMDLGRGAWHGPLSALLDTLVGPNALDGI